VDLASPEGRTSLTVIYPPLDASASIINRLNKFVYFKTIWTLSNLFDEISKKVKAICCLVL